MKKNVIVISAYVIMVIATISMVVLALELTGGNAHKGESEKMYARTSKNGFQVLNANKWEDFFVKGVNIGAALPGKWFTEFPEDERVYFGWFEKIEQMNANCIRVYTLLPPKFYAALDNYNHKNPGDQLLLLQEIWPEESPQGNNYLGSEYADGYLREIERDIDAIHGNAYIPERKGRAYGFYTEDVSAYVLGYLVGRELEPDEVIATNEMNKGYSFNGDYLSCGAQASPSEAWLAMNCDYVLKYEDNKYGTQHPVSIVSWPTLDPQEHDSEWNAQGIKSLEYNDKVSIDINHFDTGTKMKAGFFGAYHIYPNYPDFMNNESGYDEYQDEAGRLRYGGYLQEFIAGHSKYPALVAELGLPTGMGNAHSSPDGLNHGGLTEEQQGGGIVRMMKAIQKEGYAGGIVFEWIDEWAKKTWITEPFMIPYERHVYWHNSMDPEQNYGLMAVEPELAEEYEYAGQGNETIKSIGLKHDVAYLYLEIDLTEPIDYSNERLLIGIDTYDRERGEFKYAKNADIMALTGLEFLLDINGEQSSRILAHPGYNIAGNRFSSYKSTDGVFEEIIQLTARERVTKDGRKIDAIYQNESKLKYGSFTDNSYSQLYFADNKIYCRLPWTKLNFTDPSNMMVLDDNTNTGVLSRDSLKTTGTEGVIVSVLMLENDTNKKIDQLSMKEPYSWNTWNEPRYSERLKKSYYVLQEYFGKLK